MDKKVLCALADEDGPVVHWHDRDAFQRSRIEFRAISLDVRLGPIIDSKTGKTLRSETELAIKAFTLPPDLRDGTSFRAMFVYLDRQDEHTLVCPYGRRHTPFARRGGGTVDDVMGRVLELREAQAVRNYPATPRSTAGGAR
jgi:hypothetical protein